MSRLTSALAWSGVDVTLSLFVVYRATNEPQFAPSLAGPPIAIRAYDLDDEAGVLKGRRVREFDLVWKEMPHDLESVVTKCLREATAAGAQVAWFGFEGSFDFKYLLHPDVADQIFAVGASDEIWLALDDDWRTSDEWRVLVDDLRKHVL
jgi:hypothetical protein